MFVSEGHASEGRGEMELAPSEGRCGQREKQSLVGLVIRLGADWGCRRGGEAKMEEGEEEAEEREE